MKYVTNFQPNKNNFLLKSKKINFSVHNEKIFCKNFLVFFILIKHSFWKTNTSVNVFIQPHYANTLNILRAPYKNKISKHQITLSRYTITVSVKLKLDDFFVFNNINSCCFFLNKLKQYYAFFETNIAFQHRSVLSIFIIFKNFFLLSKF